MGLVPKLSSATGYACRQENIAPLSHHHPTNVVTGLWSLGRAAGKMINETKHADKHKKKKNKKKNKEREFVQEFHPIRGIDLNLQQHFKPDNVNEQLLLFYAEEEMLSVKNHGETHTTSFTYFCSWASLSPHNQSLIKRSNVLSLFITQLAVQRGICCSDSSEGWYRVE